MPLAELTKISASVAKCFRFMVLWWRKTLPVESDSRHHLSRGYAPASVRTADFMRPDSADWVSRIRPNEDVSGRFQLDVNASADGSGDVHQGIERET